MGYYPPLPQPSQPCVSILILPRLLEDLTSTAVVHLVVIVFHGGIYAQH